MHDMNQESTDKIHVNNNCILNGITGENQVKIWRRSYDVRPPAMEATNSHAPSHDSRYKGIPASSLPLAEVTS